MKPETETKLKKMSIYYWTIFVLILGSFIGYTIAQSSNTFYVTTGVYPSGVVYTVYREGDNYYAKNRYGYIDYESTNASYIINSALGHRGITYLLHAVYNLSRGIKVTVEGSALIGETQESGTSVLYLNNEVNEDIISTDSEKWNFRLEHIFLHGNNAHNTAGNGVNYSLLSGMFGYDVFAYRCAGHGFYSGQDGAYFTFCKSAENNGSGFYMKNNYGSKFYGCYTRRNGLYGYYITSDGGVGSGDLDFVSCETDGGGLEYHGWYIDGSSTKRIKITNANALNMIGASLVVTNYASNVYFEGNMYGSTYGALITYHASMVEIYASDISHNYQDGISISDSSHVNIISCTLSDNSKSSSGTYYSIVMLNSSMCRVGYTDLDGYNYQSHAGIYWYGASQAGTEISFVRSENNDYGILDGGGFDNHVFHSWNYTVYVEDYP